MKSRLQKESGVGGGVDTELFTVGEYQFCPGVQNLPFSCQELNIETLTCSGSAGEETQLRLEKDVILSSSKPVGVEVREQPLSVHPSHWGAPQSKCLYEFQLPHTRLPF